LAETSLFVAETVLNLAVRGRGGGAGDVDREDGVNTQVPLALAIATLLLACGGRSGPKLVAPPPAVSQVVSN